MFNAMGDISSNVVVVVILSAIGKISSKRGDIMTHVRHMTITMFRPHFFHAQYQGEIL